MGFGRIRKGTKPRTGPRDTIEAEVSNPMAIVRREDQMEMDSHGGLEVTIRQTEWKKKLPNNFVAQTSECS